MSMRQLITLSMSEQDKTRLEAIAGELAESKSLAM